MTLFLANRCALRPDLSKTEDIWSRKLDPPFWHALRLIFSNYPATIYAVAADFGLKVRTEVLISRRQLWSDHHDLVAEDEMKLVRFDGGKTGLMVELPSGPHVLDVIGSLGALAPDDPISQGVLNGILKDHGKWSALIEHWAMARTGLRRLGLLAVANPNGERLIIRRADEVRIADPTDDSNGIVAIDITDSSRLRLDPTGREAMVRQFSAAPTAAADRVVAFDAYKTPKS